MGLIVAGRPTNLHLPPEAQAIPVDSDLYAMCERVREISDRLHINLILHKGDHAYVIFERCEDGHDRKVFMVKDLDARILPRLRKAMSVPLAERLEIALREQDEHKRQMHEDQLEELYERMGRLMWYRFERDGFIDQRPVSFPKAGVATRGRKRGGG